MFDSAVAVVAFGILVVDTEDSSVVIGTGDVVVVALGDPRCACGRRTCVGVRIKTAADTGEWLLLLLLIVVGVVGGDRAPASSIASMVSRERR